MLSDDEYRTTVGASQSVFSFTRSAMYSSYHFVDKADYWLEPVGDPALNEGDTLHLNFPMTYAQAMPLIITTSNQYPEISCKFADYFYSEEGFLLANYGIEGESYTMEGDYPKATDLVNNDPEGREFTQLKAQWCWLQGVGLYTYLQSKDDMADPAVYDAYGIWNVGDGAWNYPAGATLTTEESAQYSAKFTDIQTYANESIVKFIAGEQPISEFDAFVDQVKSMGIDECVVIKQASYDRYQNR
jgi:putative aldouronate transport system substrate-binding protein